MKNLEILAPAGDLKSFTSALNSGADAIYLGLNNFNARAKAENFTVDNLRDVVKLAHFYSVKVYLTVNILINDNEFEKLKEIITVATKAKIDAFIVQDLGVAKFLKECFPNIVLHASTQLGVHNLYGAKIAEKLGFSRVVLSRESRLEDIKEIKNNTNLEIEYFVQGALCTCFSGNCYISSLLSNESGNRGRCLQYCRMNYSACDGENNINQGYLLSAKDLSLIDSLKTLIDAGVCSFKIEGRLRRSGYVAKTVEIYRNALDNIIENKQNKIDISELKKVFVRGEYNKEAYLYGKNSNIIEQDYNNHSGIKIGKVINISRFKDLYKMEISSNVELSKGDGLKFYDGKREVGSLGIGNIEKLKNGNIVIFSKTKVQKDNFVHLILDSSMEEESENNKRYVDVELKLIAYQNDYLKLLAKSHEIEIIVESDFICELGNNVITNKEEIENQLSKTGDSGFCVRKIEILKDNVFLPKSVLNNIRRSTFETLKEKIIEKNENFSIEFCDKKIKNNSQFNYLKNDILKVKNIEQLKKYYKNNKKALNICLKPEIYDENIINFQNQLNNFEYENFILYLPVFADNKDIKNLDKILNKLNAPILIANNIYGLYYINKFKVIAGTGLNIYNTNAVNQIKEIGCIDLITSIENNINGYEYAYGYFPLMTFLHCPYKLNYKTDCNKCSASNKLNYINRDKKFKIARIKNISCQFELLDSKITDKNSLKKVIDITNIE